MALLWAIEDGRIAVITLDDPDARNALTALGDHDGLRAALAAEAKMQGERFPHPEHQEGAAAFREKRKPDFAGGGG